VSKKIPEAPVVASIDDLRVREDEKVDLDKRKTRVEPLYESKEEYKRLLRANVDRLSDLQNAFYAASKFALLVIFQAMDTAGKDGAIKHVMSGVNPQGCQVHTFRHPSATELEHDFLWRTTQALPERGNIGIFNRSYYEEVLIARVHPEILEAEQVHDYRSGEDVWRHRYGSINDHEKHLHRSGTHVIKFFLHISKEEQRKRLLARITKSSKNWKYNPDDLTERGYWDQYMDAYQRCLSETSTEHAPWYVVPADDKRNARLFVSNIILHTMAGLEVSLPPQTEERLKELEQGRLALEAEA